MCKNPLTYDIAVVQHKSNHTLQQRSHTLVVEVAKLLDEQKMVWYNPNLGNLAVTKLGRVNQSMVTFNKMI